ncbi:MULTISPECIES: (deoxy)nucleoside triphosphate pyrophosphohydrolase [Arthrobacter]|uniref:8-oxo-dGTP diphosphatase n=2 Tax=Arthrobacter TaxID=1663 RepID=A0ABU9KM47_9MICC|nr:(deoxy)nucleoside triphosphate pyrophosphohydrolase [Arthrobacter sp. YJM1]MDP5227880.1 (deoxy)nucleoside triphosphate pyrophosphohydrolase [Arthrobacter sp. YJM1]
MTLAPRLVVGAAVLDSLQEPRMLLCARRSAPESLAGLWEFPGGKVEPGEGAEEALHRELSEELGVTAVLGEEVRSGRADGWVLNEKAVMRVWLAELSGGTPQALEDHDELRWVPLEESALNALPWIPADFPIVAAVVEATRGS